MIIHYLQTKKAAAEDLIKSKQREAKALMQGRRRLNLDLIPVPLRTLGRVQEGCSDLFLLHDIGYLLLVTCQYVEHSTCTFQAHALCALVPFFNSL